MKQKLIKKIQKEIEANKKVISKFWQNNRQENHKTISCLLLADILDYGLEAEHQIKLLEDIILSLEAGKDESKQIKDLLRSYVKTYEETLIRSALLRKQSRLSVQPNDSTPTRQSNCSNNKNAFSLDRQNLNSLNETPPLRWCFWSEIREVLCNH